MHEAKQRGLVTLRQEGATVDLSFKLGQDGAVSTVNRATDDWDQIRAHGIFPLPFSGNQITTVGIERRTSCFPPINTCPVIVSQSVMLLT